MNAPLMSEKFPLKGHSIALALTLAILTSIAPHVAFAKGGTIHLLFTWSPVSRAEASGTGTPLRSETTKPEPLSFGGCGGKRYRDPNTHRCHGPADLGN